MTRNNIDGRIREHFAELDRAGIAGWLKEGLRDPYSLDSEKPNPFDLAYPEIVHDDTIMIMTYDSVVEFLAMVYDRFFSDEGKRMFRGAIGDVLGSQVNRTELTGQACTNLVYLIGKTKADESVDSLVDFAGWAEPEKVDLYGTIANLSVLKSSEEVYEAVERLTDAPNFDEGYLFGVIEILVGSQPSNTRNILEKFEQRIKKLYDSMPNDIREREAFLDAKANCLRVVSIKANLVQYKDTWLTEDYK